MDINEKLKIFITTFLVVLVINQLFYGACFAAYCIAAAIPRVFIMSILLSWFLYSAKNSDHDK